MRKERRVIELKNGLDRLLNTVFPFEKCKKKRNLKFDRTGTTSSVNKNYNGLETLSRLHDLHYYNTMEKTVKDWIK